MQMSATYSPEDNKLRLYSSSQLDAATYERVKEAGFKWAPRQNLFVAPMWTPAREDLLIALCGHIGDEDTGLTERAEERADRFGDYSDKRAHDASAAHSAVQAIGQRFEFGQPILIGHHSESKARKDAERMESGMRRAVQMWETSEYWKRRAAGALRHAKYKELPAVRYRRIKGLEADMRKQERNKQEAEMWLKLWLECEDERDTELQMGVALRIAGMCWLHLPRKEGDREDWNIAPTAYDTLNGSHPNLYAPRTVAEVVDVAKKVYPATVAHCERWIAHYENRIAYERAMLGEQGGLKADGYDIQPGGRVLVDGEWLVVMRVNKKGGKVNSVSTNARFVTSRSVEEIKDYRAPTEEDAAKVKKAMKLPPLVNFPGEGFIEMTAEEYKRKPTDYKGTHKAKATADHGAYRYRTAFLANSGYRIVQVYITDAKRVDMPAPDVAEPVCFKHEAVAPAPAPAPAPAENASTSLEGAENRAAMADEIQAMREQLKAGVQVVSVPQLFPTPAYLAARMVEMAEIEPGMRVLEPSAGTGPILEQLPEGCEVVAVEINAVLGGRLDADHRAVVIGDFLQCTPESLWGLFDRILMNPPFANADDIKHIRHALRFLKPGGKLVAICANGPRQNAQLRPLVQQHGGVWESLPPNTFAESGTAVNTALFTLTA